MVFYTIRIGFCCNTLNNFIALYNYFEMRFSTKIYI